MTAPLRLGVVGLGFVTQLVYLPLLARNADLLQVGAVCDLVPSAAERVGDELGLPAQARFTSLDDLAKSDLVDAVLLASSGSHGAPARRAQEAGLAVLCEKPLAYTLAEADALAPDPPLQLGYMKLHDPAVAEARRALADLGALRSVEVVVLHPAPANQLRHLRLPGATGMESSVRRQLAAEDHALRVRALGEAAAEAFGTLYTDVALGSLVHELAVVRALAGEVTGVDHVETWPEGAWPPSVEIVGTLDTGARMSLRWHYLEHHPAYHEELRFHAERGTVTLRFPTPYVLHAHTDLTMTRPRASGEETMRYRAYDEAFEVQLRAFHEVATRRGSPAAGIGEGRADIVTCQRIVRRLAQRRGLAVGGEASQA